MYINKKYTIIILLIITIIITTLLKSYQSDDFMTFKYLFDTDIFDNKEVFLIANNNKLSEETLNFINNHDYNNSVVVRFNGLKPIIKDYCKGKTDVLIFRKNEHSFHGINNYDYNNKFINVYTNDSEDVKTDIGLKNGIYSNSSPSFLKLIKNKSKNNNIILTESHYVKDKKYYYTTGFQTLKSLYEKKKYKKIYLIGYTFHDKRTNYWHHGLSEYKYFNKYFKHDKNIIQLI
jgi:hypothetical protein